MLLGILSKGEISASEQHDFIAAPKELILTHHEPATGAHIGPGALALFFFGEDGVRHR